MGLCGLAALLIGALITNVALKNMVARVRPYEQFPDILLLLERQRDFSFRRAMPAVPLRPPVPSIGHLKIEAG